MYYLFINIYLFNKFYLFNLGNCTNKILLVVSMCVFLSMLFQSKSGGNGINIASKTNGKILLCFFILTF